MIIDFHSHILPEVDHGSKSSDEAKKQLELISVGGVDIVVATSHFYPHVHRVSDFLQDAERAAAKLSTFSEHLGSTKICLGAEVLLCEGINKMPDFEKLRIRGTNCMLIEMPSTGSWDHLIDTVDDIIEGGYILILAHIDRYLKHYEEQIDLLLRKGAIAQINADSLTSFFSRKRVMEYIDCGVVSAIGSDLHGADKKAYQPFISAKKNIGADNYEKIMSRSAKLLQTAEFIN